MASNSSISKRRKDKDLEHLTNYSINVKKKCLYEMKTYAVVREKPGYVITVNNLGAVVKTTGKENRWQ